MTIAVDLGRKARKHTYMHMNKCSRRYKQTTFSGQNYCGRIRVMFVIQSGVNNKLQEKVQ